MIRWLGTHFPWFVIGGAFLWSAVAITIYRSAEAPPGTKVTLRIAHWQLETGVRDAFNHFIEEYRKLHPEVHIVQDAIPEQTYGQWLTTQLMGGTASDMIEIGLGLPAPIWVQYQQRYFVPLTPWVNEPNPYNQGTVLEGVAWRQSFRDGMRGGYTDEMQEYMAVPLSQFGIRIFYNKTLLENLTGRQEAPTNYREFLAVCEQIARQKTPKGLYYVPIAGSRYHVPHWDSMMCDPITFPALRLLDFNRDGAAGNDEVFVAFQTGRINLHHPAYLAKFQMFHQLTGFFQPGYTGLTRDDAMMLFAQESAVFMTTGTWDAFSLREQAAGRFEVGMMDFPMPDKNDPEFGHLIEGPRYERPSGEFKFGITRTCKHPEVALDFLRFLSSHPGNQEMNRRIGWIPSVRETLIDPSLTGFTPNLEGVQNALNVNLGGETFIKWMQLYSLFQVRQIDLEGLIREFEPFYRERGQLDYDELTRNKIRGIQRNETFLGGFRARALYAEGQEAESLWVKYRQLSLGRLILPELSIAHLTDLLRQGTALALPGPYEYRPGVLEKARQQIQTQGRASAPAVAP